MNKLLLFLLIMVFPMTASAIEMQTTKLFIEQYSASHKQFYPLIEEEDTAKESPYNYIIATLRTQLKSSGKKLVAAQSQTQADYHVVFIDIQPTYYETEQVLKKHLSDTDWNKYFPNIDPQLPKNKYSDSDAMPYIFKSPWMRGTIYVSGDKPVGGTIIIPVSKLARIDELYHATHQEWDKFSTRDTTALSEMSMPYESVYESTLKQYEEMFLNQKIYLPKEKRLEEIEKIFTPKGKATLALARLASISWQSTLGPFEGEVHNKWDKCLQYSDVFYTRLYEYLFIQLFKKTDKSIHNIILSSEILQSLHDASGNYNCFSHNFKETTQ